MSARVGTRACLATRESWAAGDPAYADSDVPLPDAVAQLERTDVVRGPLVLVVETKSAILAILNLQRLQLLLHVARLQLRAGLGPVDPTVARVLAQPIVAHLDCVALAVGALATG